LVTNINKQEFEFDNGQLYRALITNCDPLREKPDLEIFAIEIIYGIKYLYYKNNFTKRFNYFDKQQNNSGIQ